MRRPPARPRRDPQPPRRPACARAGGAPRPARRPAPGSRMRAGSGRSGARAGPSPTTTTRSPSVGSARRTPCMAIAPSVVKAACSTDTPSGTAATRFAGTDTTSAWLARPAPAHATRWPTRSWGTPPVSSTDAGRGIAQRVVRRRGAACHVDRLAHAVLAHVAQGGGHELRISDRAHRQRPAAAGLDRRALGAARDHRRRVGNQDMPGLRTRSRVISNDRLAATEHYLLHRAAG